METEHRAIEDAKRDPAAFESLYDAYHEQIFVFVYRRVGDRDLTGDITSQVFLKALTNIRQYEPRGYKFSSWLYKIALNEVRYHFRKQSRSETYYADSETIQNIEDVLEERFDQELMDRIAGFLEGMGESAVQLIELRFFEQKSFKEISYMLGINEATAKMRTYRLLEKLKEKVDVQN